MKHLLEIIGNLFLFIYYFLRHFLFVLWFGKLPKMSVYHNEQRRDYPRYRLKDIYNDVNTQVYTKGDVPQLVKHAIIEEYINDLCKNKSFKSCVLPINIPIFDGKEITGIESVMGILQETKLKQQ